VGVILGVVYVVQQIQQAVHQTKESLKKKGLHITDSGVSVKTDRRFDREDYIDATQRSFIKTMGAASFGQVDEHGNRIQGTTPPVSASHQPSFLNNRKNSTGSSKSSVLMPEEKEKKSRFGLRRGQSGSK
jgi:hypothetical protein